MVCYAKLNLNSNQKNLFNNFAALGCSEEYIFLDPTSIQKTDNSIYELTKILARQENKKFVIDDLKSLGKNNREIAKELEWFVRNEIHLIVLNVPSTNHELSSPTRVLLENYAVLADIEIQNVKTNQRAGIEKAHMENRNLGRKRIPYPANWESNYILWSENKITSEKFRDNVGLKRGTFYNLLKQYRDEIQKETASFNELSV